MKKLLTKQCFALTGLVTDTLRSYSSAFRAMGVVAKHDRGLRASNRAEFSHQPVRRREYEQQTFKSPGSAQRFLAIHAVTDNTCYHLCHLLKRPVYKQLRTVSFEVWQSVSVAA